MYDGNFYFSLASNTIKAAPEASPHITEIPGFLSTIFGFEVLIFSIGLFWAGYIFGNVLPALSMLRTSDPLNTAHYHSEPVCPEIALPSDNKPTKPLETDDERAVFPPANILLRPSVRDLLILRQVAGTKWFSVHGILAHAAHSIVLGLVTAMFVGILGVQSIIGYSVVYLLVSVLTAPLLAAWVHTIATPRSNKFFWSRIPPVYPTIKASYKIVLIHGFASQLFGFVSYGGEFGYIMTEFCANWLRAHDMPDVIGYLGCFIIFSTISIVSYIYAIVPLQTLVFRCLATLIPSNEETIVPFDRTLGGRFEPGTQMKMCALIKTATPDSTREVRRVILDVGRMAVMVGLVVGSFIGFQVLAVQLIF